MTSAAAPSKSTALHLAMHRNEQVLFLSFLRCASRYLEFGTGGSTHAAALCVSQSVISVDSSKEWLQTVEDACDVSCVKTKPRLVHVDIGELKEWGYPKDEFRRPDWPNYHSLVWDLEESTEAEFYLVDGRFRVACFLQIIARVQRRVPIAIHDFADRPQYHGILAFADEIARAERMSIFMRKQPVDLEKLQQVLNEHRYNPE
jgi:hypothetical protein